MNKLSPSEAEVVKEIGAFLRQKRLEKSVTIEDISAATMIRLPMLQALEEGAADYLPELVYVKGFVKRYAQALKVDSKNLSDRLTQVQEPLKIDIPEFSPAVSAPVISTPAPKAEKTPIKAAGYGQREKESRQPAEKALKTAANLNKVVTKPTSKANPPYWLWGLLGLGGLLLTLGYLFTRPKTAPGVSDTKPSPVASPIVNKPVVKPSPVANKPALLPSPPLEEVSTEVKLEDDSWLLVLVDGEKLYEGVMKAGEEQTWRGNKTVSIRAGNAGAVKVSVNKNPPRNLGNAGEVKEMTFTPASTNNNP